MIKPSTMSLFEQEMHDQLAAARDAVAEAERRGDPLLLQAAQGHFESLRDLARRNGVTLDEDEPAAAAVDLAGTAGAEPLAAPAV